MLKELLAADFLNYISLKSTMGDTKIFGHVLQLRAAGFGYIHI